jgi:hypothetical protein
MHQYLQEENKETSKMQAHLDKQGKELWHYALGNTYMYIWINHRFIKNVMFPFKLQIILNEMCRLW